MYNNVKQLLTIKLRYYLRHKRYKHVLNYFSKKSFAVRIYVEMLSKISVYSLWNKLNLIRYHIIRQDYQD